MHLEIGLKAVSTAVLALCAVSLQNQFYAASRAVDSERRLSVRSERLALQSLAGVDVGGRLTEAVPSGDVRRIVACAFRDATAEADLGKWLQLARDLSDVPSVRIVGFCEGPACVSAAGRASLPANMTVLASGESVASQAVLNADATGACYLTTEKLKLVRRVRWRDGTISPATVSSEIRR